MQLGMTARNFSLLRKHRVEVRKFCLFVKSFSRVLMYAHSSPCRASNTACKHLFVDHMHGVHLKPFQLFFSPLVLTGKLCGANKSICFNGRNDTATYCSDVRIGRGMPHCTLGC